jgi:hypothetical protein
MPDQVEDLPEGLPIASVSDAEELEASYLFAGPIWKDEIGSIPMFSISHGIKKLNIQSNLGKHTRAKPSYNITSH